MSTLASLSPNFINGSRQQFSYYQSITGSHIRPLLSLSMTMDDLEGILPSKNHFSCPSSRKRQMALSRISLPCF